MANLKSVFVDDETIEFVLQGSAGGIKTTHLILKDGKVCNNTLK